MARKNTKPSLDWLKEALDAPSSGDGAAMPPVDQAVFDAAQVQASCLGSAATGRTVLEAVLTHGPRMLNGIQGSHQAQKTNEVLNQVHGLRGVAQILGAYSTAQVCLRVELAYESSSPEERGALVSHLLNYVTPLFDSIRLYLDTWAA